MTSRFRCAAALVLAAALALPAGGALAQANAPGQGYRQDSPPSGNAAMTPLAAPKPKQKGGCLKYGAAGGHLAHHCGAGMYVKHRSKEHVQQTGQP